MDSGTHMALHCLDCLDLDVIMSEQCKEEAGNRFDAEREKDQNNWTAGRLTSQLRKAEEEVQRAKRIAARIEAEKKAAGN